MQEILNQIVKANDIKLIKSEEYKGLSKEIRQFLIRNISSTGGHLASNLGAVELTMALHLTMDFPKDKLVWDVGHQAYTHKILTGRKNEFKTLRTYEGLSGFPKENESDCDAFDTGHSSTSISAAMGMAKARDLNGEHYTVAAVIGDGALSGGLAFEALNNAGRLDSNFIIVLNDNEMSISENVGAMANYLGKLRTNSKYKQLKKTIENAINKLPQVGERITSNIRKSKDSIKRLVIPGMLFEDMGITYIGPIDGHNIEELKMAFDTAKCVNKAVLVHVITKKGKGYKLAEENPTKFHGIDPFDMKTGESKVKKSTSSYTDVFSETIVELADKHEDVVAVSAAMPQGTGLSEFKMKYPERFVDVGIAEEHAVTFAAGLAASGKKPVVAIYSTFLQRAYDQILHDVCINKRPVIFAIDRAGLVGNDGETHQGIFDISYLSHIPNMTLLAPKNGVELKAMFAYAYKYNGPIAIRYPRGSASTLLEEKQEEIRYGKSEFLYQADRLTRRNKKVALLAIGSMVEVADRVAKLLEEDNYSVTLVNVRFINPVDLGMLHQVAKEHEYIVSLEENVKRGGYGERIDRFLKEEKYDDCNHINISLADEFIEQGDVSILYEKYGLDSESIYKSINLIVNRT